MYRCLPKCCFKQPSKFVNKTLGVIAPTIIAALVLFFFLLSSRVPLWPTMLLKRLLSPQIFVMRAC